MDKDDQASREAVGRVLTEFGKSEESPLGRPPVVSLLVTATYPSLGTMVDEIKFFLKERGLSSTEATDILAWCDRNLSEFEPSAKLLSVFPETPDKLGFTTGTKTHLFLEFLGNTMKTRRFSAALQRPSAVNHYELRSCGFHFDRSVPTQGEADGG